MLLFFLGNPTSRGRGRGGRGRDANSIPISGGRKNIMKMREQRRKEDIENALRMKQELAKEKEMKQGINK